MDEPQGGEQPLNPDLAGYPSVDALVAGYRNSGQEAKRLADENRRLQAERDAALQYAANPRQDVPQRGNGAPLERLREIGVDTDALAQYVGESIRTAFQPIQQGFEARNAVLGRYPDYGKFESDVAQFVQSDPALNQTYQRMFQADPAGAFEYAFLKFGESRRRTAPQNGDLQGEAAHAAIPSGMRAGDSRRPPDEQGRLNALFQRYQQTQNPADARAYARARLGQVITDEWLNS